MFIISLTPAGMAVTAISILFIKLAGLAATVLLLYYDVDKTNSFIKNICSAGKQTSCDAVLNSKASKLFGFTWGEIGFFYFASSTLFLLFPATDFFARILFLCFATAFAAPYILFSVYYQWKVVKKWCMLCLWVQAVLALEIMWAAFSFPLTSAFSAHTFPAATAVGASILLPVIMWLSLKPLLKNAKERNTYKAAYKRLLYNPDIFESFLAQQQEVAQSYENLGITLGNPDAATTIIKVCNPYCGPCAKAHPELEDVLKHNNDIRLKIIFTATNNEHDRGGIVVKHLLAIAEKNNAEETQQALDDWYMADKKDYNHFAAKYPMNGEVKKQVDKIDAMSKWCKEADILYTSAIFINGKRLPENYSIAELKHIF
jgi:protein-disulfide isomerase